MKKYKAVIIGLGQIGFKYDFKKDKRYILSYARAFLSHKGFDLTAGVDIDNRALRDFKKAYKKEALHYRDLKKALKGAEVIAVSVPASDHLTVTRDIFRYGSPALIAMEKPLSDKISGASEILKLCKKHKTVLYVNYFRRTDTGINKLKADIRRKSFGRLAHVNIYYGRDLLENGSHFIDLMLYMFGRPDNINILAKRIKNNPDFLFEYKDFSVFFKSDSETDYNFKEMDFLFERGRVRYLSLPKTEIYRPNILSYFGVRELGESKRDSAYCLDMEKFMYNVADHMYSNLAGRSRLNSDGHTAMDTLKICGYIMKRSQNE